MCYLSKSKDSILKFNHQGPRKAFNRPWEDPVAPLTESSKETVLYPSEDDEYGMVHIGFRGPPSKVRFSFIYI